MNQFADDPQLESWLRDMPLVQPSARLDRRVLGPAVWRTRTRWAVAAAVTAAAAAVAFVLVGLRPEKHPAAKGPDVAATSPSASAPATREDTAVSPARHSPKTGAVPKDIEETFTRVSYVGLRYFDDSTPVQEYRRESVRRVWTFDPALGVETEQVVPVEEVILVRTETQ